MQLAELDLKFISFTMSRAFDTRLTLKRLSKSMRISEKGGGVAVQKLSSQLVSQLLLSPRVPKCHVIVILVLIIQLVVGVGGSAGCATDCTVGLL